MERRSLESNFRLHPCLGGLLGDHCYAVRMTHRLEAMHHEKYSGLTVLNGKGDRHFNGTVRTHEDALSIPLKWRKPRRVFVNSMSDLFHRDVPFDFIDKVFAVMALCPQHTFQVLTKRPERMAEYLNDRYRVGLIASAVAELAETLGHRYISWNESSMAIARLIIDGECWPLPNVWLGTSCENQKTADERIPHLLKCPAAVRFLSCEPLLGRIHFWIRDQFPDDEEYRITWPLHGKYAFWKYERAFNIPDRHEDAPRIHWVIVGGESGGGARPCDIAWIRSIIEQCKAAGVSAFCKQLGGKPCDSTISDGKKWNQEALKKWPSITKFSQMLPGDNFHYLHLRDHKGGDIEEFPIDLRVREFPR